jgi:hypothetical protein
LEAERRGQSFFVVDETAGATSTRAAAGLFNPLTGPRFTADGQGWDTLVPHYLELEQRLGVALVHPLPLVRPLAGAKVGPEAFPLSAPGWTAAVVSTPNGPAVRIEGGGWVDLRALVDTTRVRWLRAGVLEARRFHAAEGAGREVLWCGGLADFLGPVWGGVEGVAGLWQAVRGDVLTVRIPGLGLSEGEIGARFLLPLGGDAYRWGATHESDVLDQGPRPEAKALLENDLRQRLAGRAYEVIDHAWGVRPASRTHAPLLAVHPDEPGWRLFNGWGGRGVALIPRWLDRAWG